MSKPGAVQDPVGPTRASEVQAKAPAPHVTAADERPGAKERRSTHLADLSE
jgi:hypothetical protein